METKNKKYLDKKANKEYYAKSDGNFMPLQQSVRCYESIDRLAWARKHIHDLDSRTHIDCGCKDGYFDIMLELEGVSCLGIDPSEDSIAEAVYKATSAGLDGRQMFKKGMIEDLPNLKADTVTCLEVIEHVVDAEAIIKKLSQMGRFVMISTPDANGRHGLVDAERNEEHVRVFTQLELEELVGKYGDIIESVIRDDQICIIYEPK